MTFTLFDLLLNLDTHLIAVAQEYGLWIYAILFLIIFIETGFVVTPFLPGDSLIFVTGALAQTNVLDIWLLFLVFTVAAVVGDTVNYWIGSYVGQRAIEGRFSRFIKKEWLDYTGTFFERYGGLTIVIARFIPYIRTFAPFLAGIGTMRYREFIIFNIAGGVLWTSSLLLAGYYFGSIEIVKENFTLLMYGVLFLCLFALGMIIHRLICLYVLKHD